jgi:hypothetical protein
LRKLYIGPGLLEPVLPSLSTQQHFRDGKALHIVDVESQDDIVQHLEHFHDIYECSEMVEISERQP